MIATAALAASLFATICIDGTLHGLPNTLCREFQVRGFPTVESCEREHKVAVDDWLASIAFMKPHLMAIRCGPAEHEEDDS